MAEAGPDAIATPSARKDMTRQLSGNPGEFQKIGEVI